MDTTDVVRELNAQFIGAFRQRSWELLQPVLAPSLRYLDGATGDVRPQERYIASLTSNPSSALDGLAIHVDGDTAVVTARSVRAPGRFSRSIDTYVKREGGWACIHACVWLLAHRDD